MLKPSIPFFFLTMYCHVYGQTIEGYLFDAQLALQKKDAAAACTALDKAYQLDTTNINTLSQISSAYFKLGDYKQSAQYYEQLLQYTPNNNQERFNCAITYTKQGEFDKALYHLEQLGKKFPDEPHIRGNLLKLYLRKKLWHKAALINKPQLWWYDTNMYGKTVLLELAKPGNGLGDAFMFIRYAQWLHQAGARVVVQAPNACLPLFARCPFIDTVIGAAQPPPPHNYSYSICIASLMQVCRHKEAMGSIQSPYLEADPALVDIWKNRLAHDTNFKIGLCWQTNFIKDLFTGTIIPSPRSISLAALQPLAQPGISFYSLEKNITETELPFQITIHTDDFDQTNGRFMDTAALIANCDLIISVDTAIAHLAGALGKPVWLILGCESDYRWFEKSEHVFWYPNMRIFRQETLYNWEPVIQKMQDQLTNIIKNYS